MINVTKTFLPDIDLYIEYLKKIWISEQITNNGQLYIELTEKLRAYLGCNDIQLLANGTLSLQLAIKSLGLKNEIITTPYSYVATVNSILWEGCTPIFADIDSETFCIDPLKIELLITDKTTAILATHVYGNPCNISAIENIAKIHNLKVIYDASHAFGVTLNGESILNYGDCSTLSFHATKLFHTGEGGAVVTKSKELSDTIYLMSKFGHIGEDEYIDIGINAKMTELHAAIGLAVLPSIDSIIARRRDVSIQYDQALRSLPIEKPKIANGVKYNYSYYPVVFNSPEDMRRVRGALLRHDINPRRYFYPSLNLLPFLSEESRQKCPISESIANRVLCLPLYYDLEKLEINLIATIIANELK